MGQREEPPPPSLRFDWGVLGSPRGALLGAELVLAAAVLALLAAPAPPTLPPALLHTLAGGAALGGRLLRDPPPLPHGCAPCLDLLRALSGAVVFLLVALVALATSRDALAATTFTFSLLLSLLFAFDAVVTYREHVGRDAEEDPA